MLLPSPPVSPQPRSQTPRATPRRRGAQPRNTNTLKHGLYSSASPLRRITLAVSQISSALRPPSEQPPLLISDIVIETLRALLLSAGHILNQAQAHKNTPLMRASARVICNIARKISGIVLAANFWSTELEKTALLSTLLPIWQFKYYYGIARDADDNPPIANPKSKIENRKSKIENNHSFLVVPQKSGHKSELISPALHDLWWLDSWQEPEFIPISLSGTPAPKTCHIASFDDQGWFTAEQWALLAPLLPPQPLAKPRGRPAVSSHAVLSAIFWLRAHGLTWKDLPAHGRFPPGRTCRRYYKRWLLSGRLAAIYEVVQKDLLQRGRLHPLDFVQLGYFEITEDHRISTVPGICPDTWQTRAALFFMQESYALIRRIRREDKNNYFPPSDMIDKLAEQYPSLLLR